MPRSAMITTTAPVAAPATRPMITVVSASIASAPTRPLSHAPRPTAAP